MLEFALPVLICVATCFVARRLCFDLSTILLLLAGLALYYFHFYHSLAYSFGTDAHMHTRYIEFIIEHRRIPEPREEAAGNAAYHQPLFYIVCALFYEFARWFGTDTSQLFQFVRHVPLALYVVFLFFSLCLLRRYIPSHPAKWMASALLIFWPVGVVISSRIHSDLLMYVGQIGTIFFLSRWITERQPNDIAHSFVMVGIACLAKASGFIWFIPAVICGLWSLSVHRNALRSLLTIRLLLSVSFAVAAYALATLRYTYGDWVVLPNYADRYIPFDILRMLTYFYPWEFLHTTIVNPREGESGFFFWNFYLRSLILGDFISWHALSVVHAFGVVWLAMLLYLAASFCLKNPWTAKEKSVGIFFTLVAGMMTAMLMYVRFKLPEVNQLSDARYVFAIVTLIVLAYGKTLEWHGKMGRTGWLQAGRGLAFGFIMLTFALYIGQYLLFSQVYEGGILKNLTFP